MSSREPRLKLQLVHTILSVRLVLQTRPFLTYSSSWLRCKYHEYAILPMDTGRFMSIGILRKIRAKALCALEFMTTISLGPALLHSRVPVLVLVTVL